MKRPTITKQQTINALVELRRRDHNAQLEVYREDLDAADAGVEAAVHHVLLDSVRLAKLILTVGDYSPIEISTIDGSVDLKLKADPEVAQAIAARRAVIDRRPNTFDESKLYSILEDKLTGCDPQSLLSVPENVASMRAILNGLELLPKSALEIELEANL